MPSVSVAKPEWGEKGGGGDLHVVSVCSQAGELAEDGREGRRHRTAAGQISCSKKSRKAALPMTFKP